MFDMAMYYATLITAHDRIVTYYDEDRDAVIGEMIKYVKQHGFTFYSTEGRFTIHDYVLVERESPIFGSPVLSETSYYKLVDHNNRRRDHAWV